MELFWPNKSSRLISKEDGRYERTNASDPRLTPHAPFQLVHNTNEQFSALSHNLLIQASCLTALRTLSLLSPYREMYQHQAKLIYLDPPFNTGRNFKNYPDALDSDVWLSLFYETCLAMKDLLHPDGALFVHLDDIEQHHARIILDEVYGEATFVGTLIWENYWKIHLDTAFSQTHNYIHVYSPLGNTAWAAKRHTLPHTPDVTALEDLLPRSLWHASDVGNFPEALSEAHELFPGEDTFSTPKPERLLRQIIHIATNPGDLVIDPFAGSGSTSAVAHKMGRAWITIERERATVESFILPRLTKVIAGTDHGGVSKELSWTGGGEFSYVTLPSL